jgi:hypothetical protein
VARTRYRELKWRSVDSFVTGAAAIAAGATLVAGSIDSRALRYEPYPALSAPAVGLPLLAALLLLLAPALAAPKPGEAPR